MSDTLQSTIDAIAIPGKGILAADESTGTMGKRLASINLPNEEAHRREYREILATTPSIGDYISGVILFSETFSHTSKNGTKLADVFQQAGVVPGIKVDGGLIPFASSPQENITQGLDGMPERLETFKAQGARFAKWRGVYSITKDHPSQALIQANADLLARYAAICQHANIVPIVEPEVLMDGPHSIETCANVTEHVLRVVFQALSEQSVSLEHIILKPNMVIAGSEAKRDTAEQVATHTVRVLRRTVPAAVPTINFLSGGQSAEQATDNLNAINSQGTQPWQLSFSYGRALQEHCIKAWKGDPENWNAAQDALLTAARNNSQAALGQYQ